MSNIQSKAKSRIILPVLAIMCSVQAQISEKNLASLKVQNQSDLISLDKHRGAMYSFNGLNAEFRLFTRASNDIIVSTNVSLDL